MISLIALCLARGTLQGCKHPPAIVGEDDIGEENGIGRSCTLEQFRDGSPARKVNEVTGDYQVNYKAKPVHGQSPHPYLPHSLIRTHPMSDGLKPT